MLHHLRQGGLLAVLESVRTDNHPPLGFLLIGIARAALGEGALALRLPGLLFGLGFVVVVGRLGRRFGAPLAPALAAGNSYIFLIATEARMYPMLALAGAGLLDSILQRVERPESVRPSWPIALWVAVGLHTHYYFVHVLAVLGLSGLLLAVLEPERRPALGRMLLGGLAGVAAALPWYLWALPFQLGHGLPTGGQHGALADLPRGYGHLFFIHATLAGDWASRALALPGVALALAALGLGSLRLWRGTAASERRGSTVPRRQPADRAAVLFLLALGLGLPLLAWGVSQVYPRASYGWRYLAGAAGAVYVIGAAGLAARPGRFLAPVLFALLGAVTAINLASPGVEDYRGATRYVLERAAPGDRIVLKGLWSQDQEHSLTGWDYYAERLGEETLASGVPAPEVVRVEHYRVTLDSERVWVLARYRYPAAVLAGLQAHFGEPGFQRISQALSVRLYSSESPPTGSTPGSDK